MSFTMDPTVDVAVTGIGITAPGGGDRESFWTAVRNGVVSTGPLTAFDCSQFGSQVAAQIADEHIDADIDPSLDRMIRLALTATREAQTDASRGGDSTPSEMVAVCVGTAVGNSESLESDYVRLSRSGHTWDISPLGAPTRLQRMLFPSAVAAEVAREVSARGPALTISTGCTSGIDALINAAGLIRSGRARVVVAGAADAPVTPISAACFDTIRATTRRNDSPETASRPFDKTRDGFVLAEGAAMLVLEDGRHARDRGARIYGYLNGSGRKANAYHMTGLKPDGIEMAAAFRRAMAQAGVGPADIDYVNAHGSGTAQNDRHETAAIKLALGPHAQHVPVSSIKSMIGHSLGAIGSIEAATCLLAIRDSFVPPTANLLNPDPQLDLDYVPVRGRSQRLRNIVTLASGFGGFQSALVIGNGPKETA
ncbi:beta-ketoacyl-[acyl-carrier-protein] synthase family protein [Cutibacterium avidum]|uniref:beta-ketoacyl-[acyl-carrier-protein] synthase family protein n=1 Tax=Actinomycetes TaxID=1760 RepID=UPI002903F425|nr:beta-ketoacyl-[acyl-carrier-protein] synthase family protein [Actinomyces sp.]MDU1430836.1 beta-ketoacyl-[acyl-carrier-protein] synthase family protein [Actinomyces sp.]MDU5516563.1 beta-ketoacyl-[acyl-carrier-protein] synthase family protein [Cutibacterium avidum]